MKKETQPNLWISIMFLQHQRIFRHFKLRLVGKVLRTPISQLQHHKADTLILLQVVHQATERDFQISMNKVNHQLF